MKRLLIALFATLLLAGCTSPIPEQTLSPTAEPTPVEATQAPTEEPTATPTEEPTPKPAEAAVQNDIPSDGTPQEYKSAKSDISLTIPADWIEVSVETLNRPSVAKRLKDAAGIDIAQYASQLGLVEVIFIDPAASSPIFSANMNIVVVDQPQLTNDAYVNTATLAQLTPALETQFSQMFQGFAWVETPMIVKNAFSDCIVSSISYDLAGTKIINYQCQFVHNGKHFTLTFTCTEELFDDMMRSKMEDVLASITLP